MDSIAVIEAFIVFLMCIAEEIALHFDREPEIPIAVAVRGRVGSRVAAGVAPSLVLHAGWGRATAVAATPSAA